MYLTRKTDKKKKKKKTPTQQKNGMENVVKTLYPK